MSLVKIRKVKKEDIKLITAGFRETYLPLFKEQHLSQENIREMYSLNNEEHFRKRIEGNFFFVAEIDHKIVGTIGLRKNDNSNVHNRISTFFVLKNYRGQKIGSLLYNKVFNLAKKLNVKKLVVNSSIMAENIYKCWSFKKVKILTKKYPNGEKYKNVWMEKIIN